MYFGDDTTQGTTLENTIQRIFRYRLPGEVCLHYLPDVSTSASVSLFSQRLAAGELRTLSDFGGLRFQTPILDQGRLNLR